MKGVNIMGSDPSVGRIRIAIIYAINRAHNVFCALI